MTEANLIEARRQLQLMNREVDLLESSAANYRETNIVDGHAAKALLAQHAATNVLTSHPASKIVSSQPQRSSLHAKTPPTPPLHTGAPAPPRRTRAVPNRDVESLVSQVVREGWGHTEARAAVEATNAISAQAAKDWLQATHRGSGLQAARSLRKPITVVRAPHDQKKPFPHSDVQITSACESKESPREVVSIRVRGPDGGVVTVPGTFTPDDVLERVLLAYLASRGNPESHSKHACHIVVPWLRKTFSHSEMHRITLKEAGLCPCATIVVEMRMC